MNKRYDEPVKELYDKAEIMNDFPVREISPGLHQIGSIFTGDGGRKMFEEALREEGRKLLASFGKVKPSKIPKKVISREEIEKTLKDLWYGKD